ncbi:hypothetical protein [Serratia marcescens]|uniref:hypothetical protein n=1 Tax=Serratia marcescens TaxID=615 RepID=UPI0007450185|nr:hypothetical protein [Serratia marcescens]CVB30589.1 Uncharacterised protein [Serratia marcescens]CVB83778.1 Uncharacterised protein [Serratia marcescens]CVF87768.1 Uncharacterised protein [Serratia marcescens]CVG57799.1 Uncharacterised protein [Serratia marcescens]
MDKLSELSKPVAWIIGEESIEEFTRGYETFVVRGDDVDSTEETMKLYSQEYVSALLAELEFEKQNNAGVAGMVEDYETKLAEKDKRIAELEGVCSDASQVFKEIGNELGCNPDNESIMMAIDALKERLATPVRLPKTNGYWDEQEKAFEDAITLAKRAIWRAGFKVEGDE